MAEPPEPVAALDHYLATTTVAHEAIWELRSSLLAAGRDDDRIDRLFAEAAELMVGEQSRLLREARRLRALWAEQELLDPDAAEQTVARLTDELERLEPSLRTLRTRQNEIARDLRRLVEDDR
jgi:hypothetical protein